MANRSPVYASKEPAFAKMDLAMTSWKIWNRIFSSAFLPLMGAGLSDDEKRSQTDSICSLEAPSDTRSPSVGREKRLVNSCCDMEKHVSFILHEMISPSIVAVSKNELIYGR